MSGDEDGLAEESYELFGEPPVWGWKLDHNTEVGSELEEFPLVRSLVQRGLACSTGIQLEPNCAPKVGIDSFWPSSAHSTRTDGNSSSDVQVHPTKAPAAEHTQTSPLLLPSNTVVDQSLDEFHEARFMCSTWVGEQKRIHQQVVNSCW